MLYSLDDITIIPAVLSDIEHRSECVPYDEHGKLPLFAAPMSCVIDMNNFRKFEDVGINTIIPRNIDIGERFNQSIETFVAMSLDEFDNYIVNIPVFTVPHYVCVDIANGHMRKLYDLAKEAKRIHGDNLVLMIGNIANPDTFLEYAEIGVDYIRIGIGSGNVCTTSANTGIHYPMGSLITNISYLKAEAIAEGNTSIIKTKIVADGGFKNFDQIIKALALGADYVMLGQILAKSEEACGDSYWQYPDHPENLPKEDKNRLKWDPNGQAMGFYTREYYGMSTKRAQKEFGKEGDTTAEGIYKMVDIDYPITKWIDNFKHYLRSAMSYTNNKNLENFKHCEWDTITPTGRMSFYK